MTTQLRHSDVTQYDPEGRLALQLLQRLPPIRRLDHPISVALENEPKKMPQTRLVVDNEHRSGGRVWGRQGQSSSPRSAAHTAGRPGRMSEYPRT